MLTMYMYFLGQQFFIQYSNILELYVTIKVKKTRLHTIPGEAGTLPGQYLQVQG